MKTTKTTTKTTKAPKATPAEKSPILSGRDAVAALAGGKKKGKATEAQRKAAVADAQAKDAAANAPAVNPAPATTTPAGKTKATKPEKKDGKMSGLDAAAKVLAEAGAPMHCKAMVEQMLAKGYWSTGGKTPAATIYSAILREIDSKPGESRFTKTDRGLFGLAPAKKAN